MKATRRAVVSAALVLPLVSIARTAFAAPLLLEVESAAAGFDQRTSEPVVTITLAASGRAAFARFTSENVGRKVDIRVDGKSVTKPVIREPILGGLMQISGGMTAEDARAMASRLSDKSAKLEVDLATD
jgi:preprotein translocase subunit SecD